MIRYICAILFFSLSLFSQSEDYIKDSLEADYLTYYADTLIMEGKLREAISYFEKAAIKFEKLNRIDRYLNQYSGIAYCLSVLEEDIKYLNYLPYLEKYKKYEGSEIIWSYYLRLSSIYKLLANYDDALIMAQNALKFVDPNTKVEDEIYIYHEIANIYYYMGDYKLSQLYLNKILVLTNEDYLSDAQCHVMLGHIELKKNNFPDAINEYQKSLYFIELEKKVKLLQVSKQTKKIIHYELSKSYKKTGNYSKALKHSKKLLENYNNYLPGLVNLAQIYNEMGEITLAKEMFSKAKIQITKTPLINEVNFYIKYGDFYKSIYQIDSALNQYQIGITTLLSSFHNKNFMVNPKKIDSHSLYQYLMKLFTKKAQTLYQYYEESQNIEHLKVSLESYQLAAQLIILIRQGIQTEASKQFLAEQVIAVYEGAIASALKLWEMTGKDQYKAIALEFAEQNKAMVLLEVLKDQEAKSLYLPDSLVDLETDYKTQIAYYEKSIYKENNKKDGIDTSRLKDWESVVFELKRKFDKFQKQVESDYPDYYNLKYKAEIITLEETQSKLAHNAAMIEYFVGDSSLYSFVITKNNLDVIKQKRTHNFREVIEDYQKSVGDFYFYLDSTEVAQKLYTESSDQLYNWLLKEIISNLNNRIDEIIIIPDDALSLVNFEALKQDDGNFVIEKFAISYAYSATHLFKFSQQQKGDNQDIAYGGFAPIYDNNLVEKDLNESVALRSFKTRGAFLDLPEARDAVKSIAGKLKGDFWLGAEATESNFKENAHKYDILHLAMHGVTDNQNPLYSKLIFTQENDTVEDNYLNAYELYNMKLNAKLAVLSACNTGYGELKRGEGVMSMARAFAYAGCPSLVMSLWSVPSDETAAIMTVFHNELKKGVPKNQALRTAKKTYLKTAITERQHPFFWAGFISIGDVSPIYESYWGMSSFLFYGIIALIGLIGLGLLFFKSK